MNPTKKIISILIVVFITVISLVLYNAFFSFDRKYSLLVSEQLRICFLISNDYSFKVTDDGFTYQGGKNTGHFTIHNKGFDPGSFVREAGDFKMVEMKPSKEPHIYQYQVFSEDSSVILEDRFEAVDKVPFHIYPRKDDCDKLRKVYKDQFKVFDE